MAKPKLDSAAFDRIQSKRIKETTQHPCPLIAQEIPKGWFSAETIHKINNISHSTFRRRMRGLLESGQVEVRYFLIRTGLRVYPVPHYKLPPDLCVIYNLPKQ